jgi:hypothetical protein
MGELLTAAKSKPLSPSGRRSVAAVRPPSGHVFRVDRRRGPVWYAKYRPAGGRQVQMPDYWTPGRNANEEWFYLKTDAGRWAAEEPAGAPEPASGVGVLGHSGHRAI